MMWSPVGLRFSRSILECASSLALFLLALPLLAQSVPKLNSISAEWIQRGTSLEVTLNGENLGNVKSFLFSGEPGLSATNIPAPVVEKPKVVIESPFGAITRMEPAIVVDEKKLVARFSANTNAPLGSREVRVVSPTGVSNPLTINVGHLPEVTESGGNGSIEKAQMISLPVTINGVVREAAQADYYKFKAAKGQELVFEIDAARRGSALDSSVAILNTSGKELARNEDFNGLDSLLSFNVPEDGEYVLQIRDFRYLGGGNYTYRCYAGALPYVESIFPFGAQRGKQVEVKLTGRNLEGTETMTLNIDKKSPLGRQEIRAKAPKGYSNLIPFEVSDFPDFTESEVNDAVDKANSVTVPVVINGRIGAPNDIDRFKFKTDKDQKLVCEVNAFRYGSPLDALLILTDAKGSVLQQNDDSALADARLEFDAKKDAEYIIGIRDLTGRGGDQFGYRLSIRPPSATDAGFVARFTPDTPRVHRGNHSRIRCDVTRLGGFDGPIRLTLQDLPTGIIAEPIVMTTAPSSGLMTISALKDAPLGTFPIKVVASGVVGGKTITRNAEPLSGDKAVKESFLTVLDAAPFTIEPVTLTASIEQNQSAGIEVLAQRNEGFTGEIKISAEGFSAGKEPITKSFDLGEVTLKASDSMGKLKLAAKQDAEVGTRSIMLKGETSMAGGTVTVFSQPLPVTVTEVPFLISSTLSRLSVTALSTNAQSAASEAATTLKLQRRDGYKGETTLTLEGVPAGVITTLEKIPADGSETTLKLVATEKAPPGTNSLVVVAAGVHNDRNYKHRSAPITLIISAPEPAESAPAGTAAAASASSSSASTAK